MLARVQGLLPFEALIIIVLPPTPKVRFMIIADSARVRLHFSLSLASGEEVDSNFATQPAELQLGDGNLPPAFERCLLGLQAGDERSFTIAPEDAFGQHNPANLQYFKRHQFDVDTVLEPGLVMNFRDPSGEIPGVITKVDLDEVEVDFNHPLTGKELVFRVLILAVEAV